MQPYQVITAESYDNVLKVFVDDEELMELHHGINELADETLFLESYRLRSDPDSSGHLVIKQMILFAQFYRDYIDLFSEISKVLEIKEMSREEYLEYMRGLGQDGGN
jgi:hypothetical protein